MFCKSRIFTPLLFSLFFILSFLLIEAPGVLQAASDSNVEIEEDFVIGFQVPGYTIEKDKDGFDVIRIDGFETSAAPGNPLLPVRGYDIALPPDVDQNNVRIDVLSADTHTLGGYYNIPPAPPPFTWVDGQVQTALAENIVDGRNVLVYTANTFFPVAVVDPSRVMRSRKLNHMRVYFTPMQYNPVRGELQFTTDLQIKVSYSRRILNSKERTLVHESSPLSQIDSRFLNSSAASSWYQQASAASGPAPSAVQEYAIITTSQIVSGSGKLADFVAHKQGKGFTVEVVTEDDYSGLTGHGPDGTADKIRKWLQDNYAGKGIQYVLLIGNPHPESGDVPMKHMYPRKGSSSYQDSPTDYYYADLTGDWDLNDDGYFGDYAGDSGTGGVDFSPEVYVGRIPVYTGVSGWENTLDSILTKIINYENDSNTDWRKSALLPMSYSDSSTDGAYLGEASKSNIFAPNGFSTWTMYQQGSAPCSSINSSFDSDEELVGGTAVRSRWASTPFGIVFWWGHGSETGAYVGYGTCGYNRILSSSDVSYLDDSHPSVVYQTSCTNGAPENTSNLGYALLKNGAIGTVSASRVSWYAVTSWSPMRYYGDNATIGYDFNLGVATGASLGKALFDSKSNMGAGWGGYTWMNLMDFNLYGDPALGIAYSGTTTPTATPTAIGTETPLPVPTSVVTPIATATPTPYSPPGTPINTPVQSPTPFATNTPACSSGSLEKGFYGDDFSLLLYQGSWKIASFSSAYNGKYHRSSSTRKTTNANFSFCGSGFSLYYLVGSRYGRMAVHVDGKLAKTINLNRSASKLKRGVWMSKSISSGTHQVSIKSSRGYINLDGVFVR